MSEQAPPPPLSELNQTELLEMYRRDSGLRLRRSVPIDRLIYLIESGDRATEGELTGTMPSRRRLAQWVEKNWVGINSQLPCKGPDRGKCEIYPCSEGRHMDCFLGVGKQIL